MTDAKEAAPKRTAMQMALDAERIAQQALGEAENASALAAAGGSGGGAVVGIAAFDQLREQVGKVTDWQAGFVDGPAGIAAMVDQHNRLTSQVLELQRRLGDWDAGTLERATDPQLILSLDHRMRMLELEPQGAGPSRPAAPHVLGLIAELQKRVYAIGKGREFKAENQRGDTTQRYNFRGIDDAQDAIGIAQREIGLIGPAVTVVDKTVSTTEVNKGSYTQVWTTVSVTARYTFQSPIDGSKWSTEGCGMGRDLGDKAESKALAGAFKYALFHGLNITVKGVFVDAETADPRIEREIGAEHRQQDAGEQGRTYGHGQPPADQPAEQWRAEQQAAGHGPQAAPAQREADNRSPEQLARDALNAVRRAANANEAAGVWSWIYQRQLLTVPVDGVPVGQHMLAAIRLLPGGAQIELPGWGQFR